MRSGTGLSIAAGLVLLVAASWAAKEFPDLLPWTNNKTTIEQELENAFAQGDMRGFYEVFRKEFPAEYAEFKKTAAAMITEGSPPASINDRVATFTADLRRAQSAHVGRAELDRLDRIMRNQLEIAETLRTLDIALCSKFLVQSLTHTEQTRHREVAPLLMKASTITLEAIADGRRRQLKYEQSTGADWQRVTDLMVERGASENDLALMDPAEAEKAGPERVCTAGVTMLTAMLALETDPRGRILSELVTLMARN